VFVTAHITPPAEPSFAVVAGQREIDHADVSRVLQWLITIRHFDSRMFVRLLLAGMLAVTFRARAQDTASSVVGCYRATNDGWHGGTVPAPLIPTALRFDSTVATFRFLPSGVTARTVSPFAGIVGAWYMARDSVRIIWSNGLSGAMASVAVRGDTLRGVVSAFGDEIGGGIRYPQAAIAAVRERCAGDSSARFAAAASNAVPRSLPAQLSRADSLGIAAALAPGVRGMIHGPAIMQDSPKLLRSGAPWNRYLEDALAAIDSTIITHAPTVTTARFNVFTADAAGDSIIVNVGVTHCDGARFGGGSEAYVVKRARTGWTVVSKRFSGSGQGRCGG